LLDYFTRNNLLSNDQHGFLQKKSTLTNLLEAINDWTASVENKLITFVLSLDFAKAFDSLSRKKLIYKLECLGINGRVLICIKSFLDNRMQRVKVGQSYSNYLPICSGVPQGSVLGPLLFVIFINDIVYANSNRNTIKLFADDLKSYISGKDYQCRDLFSSSISELMEWARLWQLPIAFKKSSWGVIAKGREMLTDLAIEGDYLEKVSDVKDLGVKFNYKLDFTAHIDDTISKAKQVISSQQKLSFKRSSRPH
jgi:ribonuclease P/MRP protein subunit RPP40